MRICSLAFTRELLYDKKNSSRTKGDGCRNGDFRMENLIKAMSAAAGSECVFVQEEMKKHTTFRIGGPADVFVAPKTAGAAAKVVQICRESKTPFYIIGNGSNLLVSDRGYRGVVIQLFRNFSRIETEGNRIEAQAGAMLSAVAAKARDARLSGFEFAAGIPGTLGGAMVMNAGAYGGELKDVLEEALILDYDGQIRWIPAEDMEFGYRRSAVAAKGWIALGARLRLREGEPEEIRRRMEELRAQRVSKQPLEYPSAGSTFKRPEGYFAGKLIMEAGLRGFSVGDAQVSEKHCGFVINKGNATASEVKTLMQEVVRRVRENSGVTLEPEVKMLGEF